MPGRTAFGDRVRLLVEHFPGWCRRCGGEGLGPYPVEAILAKYGDEPPP